jgi:hypothetical protein
MVPRILPLRANINTITQPAEGSHAERVRTVP